MMNGKGCCGHGGGKSEAEMEEWKAKYAAMSNDEKKEMLVKKQEYLEKKMAWVKEELAKLN